MELKEADQWNVLPSNKVGLFAEFRFFFLLCSSSYLNVLLCLVLVFCDQKLLQHHRLRSGRMLPARKWLLHGGSAYGQPLPAGESYSL